MTDTFVVAVALAFRPAKELCAPTQLLFQVLSWGCQLTDWNEVCQGRAEQGTRRGTTVLGAEPMRNGVYFMLTSFINA